MASLATGRSLRAALLTLVLATLPTCLLPEATTAQAAEGRVAGRVVDGTGIPVRSAEVQVLRGGRVVAGKLTDADGNFLIVVAPGDYTVRVPSQMGLAASTDQGVRVTAGQATRVELVAARRVQDLEAMVVTAEGLPRGQDQSSVSGYVGLVRPERIERRVTVDPTDALRLEPGVDMADTGLNSRITTFRGFNNIFTGSVRYMTDFRPANLPSLQANFMHFSPTATPDVARMEMVLGPSSAIYGPNSASGVLNVVTRSPLADLPESSFSFSGGNQSVFQTELRTSQRIGERLGVKVSGRWFQGEEWAYADPVETSIRSQIESDPEGFEAQLLDLGVPAEEIPDRIARIGIRDLDIRRWSVDGRVDFAPSDGDTLIFQAGRTSATGIENTPLGAAQADGWIYDYLQARFQGGNLFAQAFLNTSDAGDTYLLRDGAPLVDDSRVWGLQARHGFDLFGGAEEVLYGADWTRTTPRTGGTIHGQYEDDDEITEWGVYVQSRTRLADRLHLLANLRFDESNVVEDPVLSPRVGLVWEPEAGHTLSASWSRGFSTPTPTNYFLDLSGGTAAPPLGALGYRTRAMGTGRNGIRFSDGTGGYQGMRSPCTPAEAGGASALIPANATNVWQCVVGVLAGSGQVDPATAAFLASLDPGEAVTVNAFNPITNDLTALLPGAVPDVDPLEENTTSTLEVGYRGLIGDRLFVQTALWHTTRQSLSSPLTVATPLLTLDGAELAAFLVAQGLPPEQAQALATAAAGIPGGVLSSRDIRGQGAELVATYDNFGEIRYWGIDLGAEFQLNRNLGLRATGSWVSDDHFDVEGRLVPLNAPGLKGSLALTVDRLAIPVNGELAVRYQDRFPVASGDYVGTDCIGVAGPLDQGCVPEAVLLDAAVGYENLFGSGANVRLALRNLLDEDYQPFLGVPVQGRQLLLRLEYRPR